MRLGPYVLRRVLLAVPVLLGVTFITFSISWVANDGEMERGYLTEKTTPQQRDAIVARYGFDEPFFAQYLGYLQRLVTMDLGFSHAQEDRPVTEVLAEFVPATVELALAAAVFAVIGGIWLGTLSAVRRDGPVDHATRLFALAGVSVPIFWLGLLLKFAFATPFAAEGLARGGPVLKGVVLAAAGLALALASLFLADSFLAGGLTRRRVAWQAVVLGAVAIGCFALGWVFVGLALAIVGGFAHATAYAAIQRGLARVPRRVWKLASAGVALGALLLAATPWGGPAVEGVFAAIPDAPLGGRFSNELVAVPGEHPSLTDGPTRLLLVDTLLAGDLVAFRDALAHLVLPGITLGYASVAVITRMMRASMLETLPLDFVRTARAKGLPEPQVVRRHARRNALIPVATVVGLTFGNLLSGAVLTETIFQWPGLGRWSTLAIARADTNSIMVFALLVVVFYIVANLVVDVVYTGLDPRVRLE